MLFLSKNSILNYKTSYRKVSQSLEAGRLAVKTIVQKLERRIYSNTIEKPVNFHSDQITPNTYLGFETLLDSFMSVLSNINHLLIGSSVSSFYNFYFVLSLRFDSRLCWWYCRADSMFVPNQWKTSLESNVVSHGLGANLESVLHSHSSIDVSGRFFSPTAMNHKPE